ncbi:hypothetical protein EV646_104494 [Kribbella antiqua]|uniref:Uncharacterized protein n=1 Tax=Kribbella antiqua TaxID=2512217 RepID=A0A4R2IVF0_9ACTN|nr:hypothetical protein [Kribbella antiqua]TCO48672.1 hypothetical protein EV646_104494 [Kribbella antiqua]
MTYFIAGNTAVENTRSLAQSALPNAPQQQYDDPAPRRTIAVRARLSAVLRTAAERELRLADRIDPRPACTAN